MTESGLWAGMLPSEPVVLWAPDGRVFYHDTYTEAAARICTLMGDVFSHDGVGEISFDLVSKKCFMTDAGEWSVIDGALT